MKTEFKNNAVVLIVIEGGVADVRTVPEGVTVVVKDYDCEGCDEDQTVNDIADTDDHAKGDPFIYAVRNGNDDDPDAASETEARRIIDLDRGGTVTPGIALRQ